ncbi:MAG: hypothetical protein U0Q22_02705 [Acidimicrobiales bacterium]
MKSTRSTPQVEPGDDAGAGLVELAGLDPFAPLRWLDRFQAEVSGRVRADQVEAAVASTARSLVVRDGADVVGGLVWRAVPDLAEHFDVPVHEVAALLVRPGADRGSVVGALLDAMRDELAATASGLVMLRVEADDVAGLTAATDTGFRNRSTMLTLVNDLERRHLNPPYEAPGMSLHRFKDGPLPESTYAALRAAPSTLVDDHYHADPRLDDARCDALYDRKRARVIEGIGADVMVYREVEGTITGFGTFQRSTDVAPYGIGLMNGSFGYRPPGAPPGHGKAAAEFMCNETLLDNRFVEWDTQATNYGMVNMLIGRPSIRLVRSSHVLHCWTDES